MDTREYLPAFLAEAREHVQALGLAVVRIEAAPADKATADQVFRIAHTLKGMSATMGFEAIATLTHAMEDVFELLRQRTGGLSREAIDVLSACLDTLEVAVERIASDGEEQLDPTELVARLRGLVHARTPEQERERLGGPVRPALVEPVTSVKADTATAAARRGREHAASARARSANGTVRVDAERLDELMHLMGEFVIHRTAVEALVADAGVPGLAAAVQQLARSSQALQATVTRVRMVPIESVFLRFPRVVRDLAARLDKQVELRLSGEDTEIDRTVVDALGDPLVHLVRNALDHGLETPSERLAAGKPPAGTIELSARHAGGHVVVSVRDDGRGIDTAAVACRALADGLIDAQDAVAVDAARAAELIFTPGLSTAVATTDVSGRGVGMDVVRTSVRALGGEVTLSSEPGCGTLAQVRLPLTLASVRALLVAADGLSFAIPLDRIERTLRLADETVRTVAGDPLLALGDEAVPLLDAAAVLGDGGTAGPPPAFAVIVRGADRRVALAVSQLVGQRELVTRSLPAVVSSRAAAAGGAVLPDGSVALVVDCDALASLPVVPSNRPGLVAPAQSIPLAAAS